MTIWRNDFEERVEFSISSSMFSSCRNSLLIVINQLFCQLAVKFLLREFVSIFFTGCCTSFVHQPCIDTIHPKERCCNSLIPIFGLHFLFHLKSVLPVLIMLVNGTTCIVVDLTSFGLWYCQFLTYLIPIAWKTNVLSNLILTASIANVSTGFHQSMMMQWK